MAQLQSSPFPFATCRSSCRWTWCASGSTQPAARPPWALLAAWLRPRPARCCPPSPRTASWRTTTCAASAMCSCGCVRWYSILESRGTAFGHLFPVWVRRPGNVLVRVRALTSPLRILTYCLWVPFVMWFDSSAQGPGYALQTHAKPSRKSGVLVQRSLGPLG